MGWLRTTCSGNEQQTKERVKIGGVTRGTKDREEEGGAENPLVSDEGGDEGGDEERRASPRDRRGHSSTSLSVTTRRGVDGWDRIILLNIY